MRRRLALLGLVIAQIAVLGAGSVVASARWVAAPLDDDDEYVLAVLGSDAGPPRSGRAVTGRADAIHLIIIPADRGSASIISIPRDSYVPVRGIGRTKINAGLTKGPEAMVGTLEDLTGLEIDDWIVTGFKGFEGIVNGMDGVTLHVEQRLRDSKGAHSDLQKGTQTLTGKQALAYSRDRKSRSDGDFGRNRAQAKVLQSIHSQLVADGVSPVEMVQMAALLRRTTVSSIPPDRLLRLAAVAAAIPSSRVAREQAAGRAGWAGRASVVYLRDSAYATFADVREDGMLSELETP